MRYAGTVLTSAGSHCQASSHVREAYWVSGLGGTGSTRRRFKAILGGGKWQSLVRSYRVLSHSIMGPSKMAAHTSAVFLPTVPHQI